MVGYDVDDKVDVCGVIWGIRVCGWVVCGLFFFACGRVGDVVVIWDCVVLLLIGDGMFFVIE